MRREQTKLLVERARQFAQRIHKEWIYRDASPLTGVYYHSKDPLPFSRRTEGAKHPIEAKAVWGHAWESAWFHITGTIPAEWKGSQVIAQINVGGEACVFDNAGCPIYGLTSACAFEPSYTKNTHWITDRCAGGEHIEFWMEAAGNELFGVQLNPERATTNDPNGSYTATVNELTLRRFDPDAWAFYWDLMLACDLIACLPEFSPRRMQLIAAVNAAADRFANRLELFPELRAELGTTLYRPASASDLTAISVGHAHIDTGWLWPVRESIRKCARTFSSQVAMIEKYPGYIFGASQAQHYQFVKQHYPALYEKIRACIKSGTWEVQGGMWVEADCNIISGESMIRQFIHGKNFFRDEFGLDIRNCWIPDVFGYSAAMPQIMKGCGVDYFLTQKISWSQFNEFPHNTFWWRGIDGTEVLTHFPPENNYNAPVYPSNLRPAQERFKENHCLPEFMSLFGIGDGGGGPAEGHLERAVRIGNLEGSPKLRFGTAEQFFDRLAKNADNLATWSGELYLELHRATLTTQARTKRNNRLLENRLRAVEYLASFKPAQYPREALDRMWKTLLLNQFHDIIPGSSIRKVYEVTEREHAECLAECDRLLDAAASDLFAKADGSLTLVNTLSEAFDRPVELPAAWRGCSVTDSAGTPLPVQHDACGSVAMAGIAPQGTLTLKKGKPAPAAAPAGTGLTLENALIRYTFNAEGALVSAFDKELKREFVPVGTPAHVFTVYDDRPNNFDAWDIDIHYEASVLGTARCTKAARTADGAVRQTLHFDFAVGTASTLGVDAILCANSRRLEFRATADWHETHAMLRVAFPTTVSASDALYDIQYGYARRPTHRNTAWDMAKFEVVAHTYADLSDSAAGVALLNDCKYGHKIHEGTIDLNLLRSPLHPDPEADQGQHAFTYALLPHAGTLVASEVMREAAMLNRPALVFDGRSGAAEAPVRWTGTGVTLEVLKLAEKDSTRIVRLVERRGQTAEGVLSIPAGAALSETNMLEWTDGAAVATPGGQATLSLSPFQIRTLRITQK